MVLGYLRHVHTLRAVCGPPSQEKQFNEKVLAFGYIRWEIELFGSPSIEVEVDDGKD